MTDVLAAPLHRDGYYRTSPHARRRSVDHCPYSTSTASQARAAIPRSLLHAKKQPIDTPSAYVSPKPQRSSTIINRVPLLPQPERNHFFLGDIDLDAYDEVGYGDFGKRDLDFPVYEYAETLTPDASPDMEESQSYSSCSYATTSASSSSTVSPAPSPRTSPDPAIYTSIDDTTIKPEPSRHVDYLSHNWKEEEIWSSWRYMITKRDYYQNAARLENASWRTWAKCKYKLKTVSPETLNWMKDCDVTWLYGPLASREDKASGITSPIPSPSNEQRIQPGTTNNGKKPILKKRSMSEAMLQRSLSSSSLLQQAAAAIQSQQSERAKASHWSKSPRPQLAARAHSDFSTYPFIYIRDSQVTTNNLPSAVSSGCNSPSPYQRHIHFNNRVEQCIAVEKADDDNEDDHIEGLDDNDSLSGGLVMRSTRSNARGSLSEHQTIAMLPSTTLKEVDEPAPKSRSNSVFSRGISSLLSSVASSAYGRSSVATVPTPKVQSNFLVDDDDDDMDDINWEPSPVLTNRRDSISVARQKLGKNEGDVATRYDADSDEDESAGGLFGKAVDAVNTARDIAHVLWNIGWRK